MTYGEVRSCDDGHLIDPAGRMYLKSTWQGPWPAFFNQPGGGKYLAGRFFEQGRGNIWFYGPDNATLNANSPDTGEEWAHLVASDVLSLVCWVKHWPWHGGSSSGLYCEDLKTRDIHTLKLGSGWSQGQTETDDWFPARLAIDERNQVLAMTAVFRRKTSPTECAAGQNQPSFRCDGLHIYNLKNFDNQPLYFRSGQFGPPAAQNGFVYAIKDRKFLVEVNTSTMLSREYALPVETKWETLMVDDTHIYITLPDITEYGKILALEKTSLTPDVAFGDHGYAKVQVTFPDELRAYSDTPDWTRSFVDNKFIYACTTKGLTVLKKTDGSVSQNIFDSRMGETCEHPAPAPFGLVFSQGYSRLQYMPCEQRLCGAGENPKRLKVDYVNCCRGSHSNCGDNNTLSCEWNQDWRYRVAKKPGYGNSPGGYGFLVKPSQ